MEGMFTYFENHYIMFIFLTALMIFGVIGYFAKKKSDKEQPYKLADENAKAEKELENIAQTVDKNASLQDFMSHNATLASNPTPVQPAVVQPQPQQPVQQGVVAPQQVATTQTNNIDSL